MPQLSLLEPNAQFEQIHASSLAGQALHLLLLFLLRPLLRVVAFFAGALAGVRRLADALAAATALLFACDAEVVAPLFTGEGR